jgi:hypothetical protein
MNLRKLLSNALALGVCACCFSCANAAKPPISKNDGIPRPEIIYTTTLIATVPFPDFQQAQYWANYINEDGYPTDIDWVRIPARADVFSVLDADGNNAFFLNIWV